MMDAFEPVAVVVGVVAMGWIAARLFGAAGSSPMIAISIAGIVVGALVPSGLLPTLGPPLLAAFLPALIFEAAWGADIDALRRALVPIVVLAFPGTIVTAAIVAAGATAFGSMPLAGACVLGALVAATDPVTVIATFRSMKLPATLLTIVESEAIANDGVALVLVQALVPLAGAAAVRPNVGALVAGMVAVSAGGALLGIVAGEAAAWCIRLSSTRAARIAIMACTAYASYALAAAAGASGIFAVAAAGITLQLRARLQPADHEELDAVWRLAAFACNAAVFALIGLTLRIDRLVGEPLLLAVTIAAVAVARLVLAYGLVPLRPVTRHQRAWRGVIALAGLRGGLSLALAIGLPAALPMRAEIRDAVFAVVFATLIVQGNLIPLALRRIWPQARADYRA